VIRDTEYNNGGANSISPKVNLKCDYN